jgi:ABC-type Fe3+/spermidine/putrescine transport system ATPase subunit
LAVVGSVGAGKTTLLRCLAGVQEPEEGVISFRGELWWRREGKKRQTTPPEARGIGFVPAKPALFPHLSVEKNIAYGLRRAKGRDKEKRVEELLNLFGLQRLRGRAPRFLSSGESQLVALARALAPRPKLLLLDEPFSSLDGRSRPEIRRRLGELLCAEDIPAILVTHQLEDVAALADRVLLLSGGRIGFHGSLSEAFCGWLELTGENTSWPQGINLFFGEVVGEEKGLARIRVAGQVLEAPWVRGLGGVCAVLAPFGQVLLEEPDRAGLGEEGSNRLEGTVLSLSRCGLFWQVHVEAGVLLRASLTAREAEGRPAIRAGARVIVRLPPLSLRVIPRARAPLGLPESVAC